MQLKRYVLLNNNKIIDRRKETNEFILGILKRIENGDTENLCRQLVTTSDDGTDFIYKGDCFELFGEIEQVKNDSGYFGATNGYSYNIKDYKDKITKIYKLQGKNYICVWEKK